MMDYLWRNYNPNTKYELDSSMKQSTPSIEISLRKNNVVIINPLPRFADVFRELLRHPDLWTSQEEKMQALANCLLHILAQIDRMSGISSALIVEENMARCLRDGCYGEKIKNSFCKLSSERKQIVVQFLRKQEASKGCHLFFREAVKGIFPQAGIYFYKPDKMFLIYLPQEENDIDRECMVLLAHLFLDVTAKWQVYWQYPFGIIGKEDTMQIGCMRLYGSEKEL